jgi:hypothetical protein
MTLLPGTTSVVLVFNPIVTPSERALGLRNVLAAQLSSDGGRTWHSYRELEYPDDVQFFCYPCLYWTGDTLHVAYHHWPGGVSTGQIVAIDARYQRLTREELVRPVSPSGAGGTSH